MFKQLSAKGFNVLVLHHAEAIMGHDMPDAAQEIEQVLGALSIPIDELVTGGGGEALVTQRLRNAFFALGWVKHNFKISKIVDGKETESQSHEIDHVKRFGDYNCALEIEWNNKDPFYDRDLDTFKRLHLEGAISVGIIITRGSVLHATLKNLVENFAININAKNFEDFSDYGYAPTSRQKRLISARAERLGFARGWAEAFVSDKFGQATTHWNKLSDRVDRGVGNPCPLVLIGISEQCVDQNIRSKPF